MLLIHGTYHFRPKRIAFRNDYCLPCARPRRAVQIRTFDAEHIFWIPLVPIGFRNRWYCTVCERQTDVSGRTRRGFIWAGLLILVMFCAAGWAAPMEAGSEVPIWLLRIGAPIGAALVLVHLFRTRGEPSRKEQLANIPPATDMVCPFCGVDMMMVSSKCSCPKCGVARL